MERQWHELSPQEQAAHWQTYHFAHHEARRQAIEAQYRQPDPNYWAYIAITCAGLSVLTLIAVVAVHPILFAPLILLVPVGLVCGFVGIARRDGRGRVVAVVALVLIALLLLVVAVPMLVT
jgi:hypothetical protein